MPEQPEAILIRGGTVVDGSGADRFRADVRLADGLIQEVAPDLPSRPGERVVEATGCFVTPGFIEGHTHFDGAMWWAPQLDPLPGYGVTTTVMGNCGFSLAPVSDDAKARAEVVKIFSFFEDIPEPPFFDELPWDWNRWSEYRSSVERNCEVSANYASFAGHIAIRLAVMGMEAWDRSATPSEVDEMAALLEDALQAGALGLSTNLFDHDGDNRAVPSLQADDAEFSALIAVLARHEGTTLQVIVDLFRSMSCTESLERLARLVGDQPVRVQYGGIPTLEFQKEMGLQTPMVALHEQLKSDGRDFWTAFAHVPPTVNIGVQQSLIFAQSNEYVWHEVQLAETNEQKVALLRDSDWRARARHSWDHEAFDFSSFPPGKAEQLLLSNSENDQGPVGITLGDHAAKLGVHCSDALADWFLDNGLESTVNLPPFGKDEEMVCQLIRDPHSLGNVSDAGAHGQMLCGAGENMLLFTKFVREKAWITVEEAVHVQTGKIAGHFSLGDRGLIAPGKRADVTVWHLDEVETRPMKKAYDVPDGQGGHTWRWTRDPAPVRLTLTNGVPTFEDGKSTGARPGEMLRPTAD
jgi:N-acyl-D-aspartate/D-glutamate deacylase